MTREYFDLLAAVVDYPDEYINDVVSQAADRSDLPAVKGALNGFTEVISQLSVEELREHYAATFRPGTPCSLEIGEHLHKDARARDAFVTRQLDAMRRVGLEPLGHVPDHLTRVLAIVGRDNIDRATELALAAAPAVDRIRRGLVDQHSPYAEVFGAIRAALLQVQPAKV